MSHSFTRKARALLVLGTASLALAACSSAGTAQSNEEAKSESGAASSPVVGRTVEEIQESGTIRLGVFSDKAPFGSVDSNGDYVGYDILYGDRIAQDLGVEAEYVPVDASARVEFLESDKVDIILANFTVTDERAEKVDFANPYLQVSLGVVTPDTAPITDEAELDGKNLIIVKGTTAEPFIEENYPDAQVQKYEQYTEATNALLDGRADAWVTDNTEGLAWALSNPGFTATITSLGDPDFIAAAVKKGNTSLLDWLNEHLVKLGEEQFFHGAYEETLLPVYGDQVSPEELVVEGGVPQSK